VIVERKEDLLLPREREKQHPTRHTPTRHHPPFSLSSLFLFSHSSPLDPRLASPSRNQRRSHSDRRADETSPRNGSSHGQATFPHRASAAGPHLPVLLHLVVLRRGVSDVVPATAAQPAAAVAEAPDTARHRHHAVPDHLRPGRHRLLQAGGPDAHRLRNRAVVGPEARRRHQEPPPPKPTGRAVPAKESWFQALRAPEGPQEPQDDRAAGDGGRRGSFAEEPQEAGGAVSQRARLPVPGAREPRHASRRRPLQPLAGVVNLPGRRGGGRARGHRAQGVLPAPVPEERRAAAPAAAVPRHLPQDGVLRRDAGVPVIDQAPRSPEHC
jgi:hypothetical protein